MATQDIAANHTSVITREEMTELCKELGRDVKVSGVHTYILLRTKYHVDHEQALRFTLTFRLAPGDHARSLDWQLLRQAVLRCSVTLDEIHETSIEANKLSPQRRIYLVETYLRFRIGGGDHRDSIVAMGLA